MAHTDEQLSKLEAQHLMPIIVRKLGTCTTMIGKLAEYGSVSRGDDGKVYNNVLLLVAEYEKLHAAMTFFIHHHGVELPEMLGRAWEERNSIDETSSVSN